MAKARYQIELDAIRARINGKGTDRIDSMEALEKALRADVHPLKNKSRNFEVQLNALKEYAKEQFGEKEKAPGEGEKTASKGAKASKTPKSRAKRKTVAKKGPAKKAPEKEVPAEEATAPDATTSTETANKEATEGDPIVVDTSEMKYLGPDGILYASIEQYNKMHPDNPIVQENETDDGKEDIEGAEAGEPTSEASTDEIDSSEEQTEQETEAGQKKEKKPLNKYERRAKEAAEAYAAVDKELAQLEKDKADAKKAYDSLEKGIVDKVRSGEIKAGPIVEQLKRYDEILDKIAVLTERRGLLKDTAARAAALKESVESFKEKYESMLKESEEPNKQREELQQRKGKGIKQKVRLSLSDRKMGMWTMVGALRKDLTVVPARMKTMALLKKGKKDEAEKLANDTQTKVEQIEKGTNTKVETIKKDRIEKENKVDTVKSAAQKAKDDMFDLLDKRSDELRKWKGKPINNTSTLKSVFTRLNAFTDLKAKTRAAARYRRAINRTERKMARSILRGKTKIEEEKVAEEFGKKIEKATTKAKGKIKADSKVHKFVDKGNVIREVLNKQREDEQLKREAEHKEMQGKIDAQNFKENSDIKGKLAGTRVKIRGIQRGRQRRLDHMKLAYGLKGAAQRTAANIAAFLGHNDKAESLNTKAIESQKKHIEKEEAKVMNGSLLERAALTAGQGAINGPVLIGGVAIAGGQIVAEKADEFVRNVKADNLEQLMKNIEEKEKALASATKAKVEPELAKEDKVEHKGRGFEEPEPMTI